VRYRIVYDWHSTKSRTRPIYGHLSIGVGLFHAGILAREYHLAARGKSLTEPMLRRRTCAKACSYAGSLTLIVLLGLLHRTTTTRTRCQNTILPRRDLAFSACFEYSVIINTHWTRSVPLVVSTVFWESSQFTERSSARRENNDGKKTSENVIVRRAICSVPTVAQAVQWLEGGAIGLRVRFMSKQILLS
jgi:hypothetical protein